MPIDSPYVPGPRIFPFANPPAPPNPRATPDVAAFENDPNRGFLPPEYPVTVPYPRTIPIEVAVGLPQAVARLGVYGAIAAVAGTVVIQSLFGIVKDLQERKFREFETEQDAKKRALQKQIARRRQIGDFETVEPQPQKVAPLPDFFPYPAEVWPNPDVIAQPIYVPRARPGVDAPATVPESPISTPDIPAPAPVRKPTTRPEIRPNTDIPAPTPQTKPARKPATRPKVSPRPGTKPTPAPFPFSLPTPFPIPLPFAAPAPRLSPRPALRIGNPRGIAQRLTDSEPKGVALPFAQPQAATPRQRDCVEVKRKRRRKGKCQEGFFEEWPGKTLYVNWREVDCITRKRIKKD